MTVSVAPLSQRPSPRDTPAFRRGLPCARSCRIPCSRSRRCEVGRRGLRETLLVERQLPVTILPNERAAHDRRERDLAFALRRHGVYDDTAVPTEGNHLRLLHVVARPRLSRLHRTERLLSIHEAEGKRHQRVLSQMPPVVRDGV